MKYTDLKSVPHREMEPRDLMIGNDFLTQLKDKSWVDMSIRDMKDLETAIKTFDKHPKMVKLINKDTFDKANFHKCHWAISLPSWYNITDDVEIYEGEVEQQELEIPILVFHSKSKKLSMFLLNRINVVNQMYQVFLGIPCDTENELYNIVKMFGDGKKASN